MNQGLFLNFLAVCGSLSAITPTLFYFLFSTFVVFSFKLSLASNFHTMTMLIGISASHCLNVSILALLL